MLNSKTKPSTNNEGVWYLNLTMHLSLVNSILWNVWFLSYIVPWLCVLHFGTSLICVRHSSLVMYFDDSNASATKNCSCSVLGIHVANMLTPNEIIIIRSVGLLLLKKRCIFWISPLSSGCFSKVPVRIDSISLTVTFTESFQLKLMSRQLSVDRLKLHREHIV